MHLCEFGYVDIQVDQYVDVHEDADVPCISLEPTPALALVFFGILSLDFITYAH